MSQASNASDDERRDFAKQLSRLRQVYLAKLPERIGAVRRACEDVLEVPRDEGRRATLLHLVHKLAGSGATFGCPRISEIARPFEALVKSLVHETLSSDERAGLASCVVELEDAFAELQSREPPWAGVSLPERQGLLSRARADARTGKLIFLVEDDADLAEHIAATLRQHNYTVRVFPGLSGLYDAVRATPPIALIMDLILPEGDLAGLDAIPKLNLIREAPIPIVAISVRHDLSARLGAIRAGCTRYLAKPFEDEELVRMLDELTMSQPNEPYRIVVIDDDASLAEMYRCMLEQAEMSVTIVTDPREALDALERSAPELILMDVNMPFCTGLELAMVIRQEDAYSNVPIVFLSTESDTDRRLAAMHLGGDDFLTKPIEGWRLVRAVHARVRRARDLRVAKERMLEAKEQAEKASRAKSEFLALMSHEIRTPMNGILGMTELALDAPPGAQQRKYLGLVKSSAESLLTILNDILDFSKIEAGKLALTPIDFSLEACITSALDPLALRAKGGGLGFRVEVAPDVPPALVGDPDRLRQILVNLVGNAIKFTEKGEVSVRVELAAPVSDGATLHFLVTDTGVGIPAEQRARIFNVFEQADQSTTRRFGGTGLGLAITDRLVRMMEGRIWVESEVARGSTFHVTARFGVAQRSPERRPSRPFFESPAASPRGRILVAEDNEVNQLVIGSILRKAGFEVEIVDSGTAALSALERSAFDLALMDVLMPGLDGLETTARIRQREKISGRRLPIIATTALAMKGDREQFLARGMDGYVSKPVRSHELFAEIARWIGDLDDDFAEPAPPPEPPPAPTDAPEKEDEPRLFDREALWREFCGDEDLIPGLLRLFEKHGPRLLGACREACASGDANKLTKLAHELAGMAGNISVVVARLAKVVEQKAGAGELAEASLALEDLERATERLLQEVSAVVAELPE